MPSPGEDIQSWSTVAANNGTADPLIDWHEGQTRASVNNSSRSEMAAHAKNRNLLNGSIVTTGSANAQQFLSGLTYTAIPTNLVVRLKIGAGLTNTTSATLNMDGLGDVLIKTADGNSLLGGELVANGYVDLLYNGTNWIFLYSQKFIDNQLHSGGGIIVGKQVFATPGSFTYTPSTGTECCIIECVGGGAGGLSTGAFPLNQIFVAGGGGGGGYSRKWATATDIGATQPIIVGAGGASDAAGGATSVGTLCVANGGQTGGLGAVPGSGDFVCAGANGGSNFYNNNVTAPNFVASNPGGGAPGPFGGGASAGGIVGGMAINGSNATGFGAGGGGGSISNTNAVAPGGTGSGGGVIITEFGGRGAPGRDGLPGPAGPVGPMGPAGPGTGDVLRSGIPSTGQFAQWTDAAHIGGIPPASAANILGVIPNCGRLVYVSGTLIKFMPYNGDRIKINGAILAIPAAGFSLANTGVQVDGGTGSLAASTTYLVVGYDQGAGTLGAAFFSTGITHQASTTAGNVGVEIRTGVDTQSVIGMVRTNASGQFQDSAAARGVLSWFNRQPKIAQGKFTNERTTTSGTMVQINGEIDIGFLTWAEASVLLATAGCTFNSSGSSSGVTQIYLDGAALEGGMMHTSGAASYAGSIGMTVAYGGLNAATEGYHTATLYGQTSGGTQTWTGSNSINRCTLTAQIFG